MASTGFFVNVASKMAPELKQELDTITGPLTELKHFSQALQTYCFKDSKEERAQLFSPNGKTHFNLSGDKYTLNFRMIKPDLATENHLFGLIEKLGITLSECYSMRFREEKNKTLRTLIITFSKEQVEAMAICLFSLNRDEKSENASQLKR